MIYTIAQQAKDSRSCVLKRHTTFGWVVASANTSPVKTTTKNPQNCLIKYVALPPVEPLLMRLQLLHMLHRCMLLKYRRFCSSRCFFLNGKTWWVIHWTIWTDKLPLAALNLCMVDSVIENRLAYLIIFTSVQPHEPCQYFVSFGLDLNLVK